MELETNPQTSPKPAKPDDLHRGRTIIRAKALASVTRRTTADLLKVPAKQVEVQIYDDASKLGLKIKTPLQTQAIEKCLETPQTTVYQIAEQARKKIAQQTAQITGHEVGAVDLSLTGIIHTQKRKVPVQ